MGFLENLFGDQSKAKGAEKAGKAAPQNRTAQRDNNADSKEHWNHIMCPFCFKTFSHEEVAFRSKTFFSEESINEVELRIAEKEALQEHDPMLVSQLENMKRYSLKKDVSYSSFWRTMVGDENYALDEYSEYPIIEAYSSEVTNKEYDEDGFLSAIVDGSGVRTDHKICPHCHNILPRSYGKNKIKFMSVIGITSSGKTVYLSQLMRNLGDLLVPYNISVMYSDEAYKFMEEKVVEKGEPLPIGTVIEFVPPIYFDLTNSISNTKTTLVLYDIAGEVFKKAERVVRYGPFIKNSDGILILVDPGQFPQIQALLKQANVFPDSLAGSRSAQPGMVVDAIYNAYMGGKSGPSEISTAVAISKIDMLMNLEYPTGDQVLPPTSSIRKPVVAEPGGKFNNDQYSNVNADIYNVMHINNPALHTKITNNFKNYGYFGVSSLGCGVEKLPDTGLWTPKETPNPIRIEEPILWLLNQWKLIK